MYLVFQSPCSYGDSLLYAGTYFADRNGLITNTIKQLTIKLAKTTGRYLAVASSKKSWLAWLEVVVRVAFVMSMLTDDRLYVNQVHVCNTV